MNNEEIIVIKKSLEERMISKIWKMKKEAFDEIIEKIEN